jgi:hypothetical protein
VDHQRQTVQTLGVMVSILGHGTTDISEGDTDSDSHGDEHGGLPTVISMTHEQLVGIGSDGLPIFPWDPRVHLVSRLFHLMMAQVAPESNILHSWIVWIICFVHTLLFLLLLPISALEDLDHGS